MATKTATIPITDEGGDGVCTQGYVVRYKPSYATGWTTLTPNPAASPIVIPNLIPSTTYSYEITRYCCDGVSSTPTTGTFTTPD